MKKTIITVFLIIAVLVIALIAFNVATSGSVWRTIGGAIADPVNRAWHAVAGDKAANLINVEQILKDGGIQDKNNLDSFTK